MVMQRSGGNRQIMEHKQGRYTLAYLLQVGDHYARELPTLKLLAYNPKIPNSTRRTHGCGLQPPARWAKLRPEIKSESEPLLAWKTVRNAPDAILCTCGTMITAFYERCQVVPHPHIMHRERPPGWPNSRSVWAFLHWFFRAYLHFCCSV